MNTTKNDKKKKTKDERTIDLVRLTVRTIDLPRKRSKKNYVRKREKEAVPKAFWCSGAHGAWMAATVGFVLDLAVWMAA